MSAEIVKACAETIGRLFVEDMTIETPPGRRGVAPKYFSFVFQMLSGYAIETLLKGIRVARHRDAFTVGRLPSWLQHHNLEALLKEVGVELDRQLLAFVRRAHAAVVWSGRYPVPNEPAALQQARIISVGDLDRFLDIYERLHALLRDEIARQKKDK